MLTSLSIRNFVLIEDAILEFAPGLTVLTGETGAGKTLLTQALELLLGERAAEGLVGNRGDEALIQAVFALDATQAAELGAERAELADLVDLQPGELLASRRLHRAGRNRSFVNDAAVTLGAMGDLLGGLVAFSGQHEHRRLLEPGYQRQALDLFAGGAAAAPAAAFRAAWQTANNSRRRLAEAARLVDERARERELLQFQVDELGEAALSLDEEAALMAEQRVLSRAEELVVAAGSAADALQSDAGGPDACGLASVARGSLHGLMGVDDDLDAIGASLDEGLTLLDEAARELRAYADRVSVDPQRLRQVEDRLQVYTSLGRKYGGTTAAAIAHNEAASDRLLALDRAGGDLRALEEAGRAAEAAARVHAADLTAARCAAAPALARAVEVRLAGLGLPGAGLVVDVRTATEWAGLTPAGADTVEFLVATNVGLPARSLARTASGGELSRILLALKTVLAGVESKETLVFDEIDAGIGGLTATAVGRTLADLSATTQVVVVTHLAQVAAFAERHYRIEKVDVAGETVTRLALLDEDASLAELSRMMGGEEGDPGALAHARALRERASAG